MTVSYPGEDPTNRVVVMVRDVKVVAAENYSVQYIRVKAL
jgi:hypothetical protein